jgi:hypothetical protein
MFCSGMEKDICSAAFISNRKYQKQWPMIITMNHVVVYYVNLIELLVHPNQIDYQHQLRLSSYDLNQS